MLNRRDFLTLLSGTPLYLRLHAEGAMPPWAMPEPISDLAKAFGAPPESTRPYVLWMWMGSNISKQGITLDLEAMKEAGIGGATIFSLSDTVTPWAGEILKSPTPEIVTWSEPWWEMVRYAAGECKRLGLELILHNCAGYESSGGPWITPELSLQQLIWSEEKVEGGKTVHVTLKRAVVDPHSQASFPDVYIPALGKVGSPIVEGRVHYYRDIALLALPADRTPALNEIVDLSAHMNTDGDVTWDAPEGNWSLYRFGHTTTGAMTQPAQWGAMGLECDKMSTEAVTFHVKHVLGEITKHLGDLAGPALTTLYFDSYEAGIPTWTPRMPDEFKQRRGYDVVPWLPAMAGRTLGSKEDTERFHADWLRTTKDLYRDCYWAVPRKLAHEAGLQFVAEPYSGPWEIDEVVGYLDHANMEFWTTAGKFSPVDTEPVISSAHDLGQRIVGAEAFTTDPRLAHWNEHPGRLKPIGDAAFCAGVNRLNLHHFVQQAWSAEYQPGNTMGQWGIHFSRYQTWWEPGKAWFQYLWRCQTLLQAGNFVAPSPETAASFGVEDGTLELHSIHRRFKQDDIYFVANVSKSKGLARCNFPVSGKQPELWDPVLGTMRPLMKYQTANGVTTFKMPFESTQSCFIVFRKAATAPPSNGVVDFPGLKTIGELDGGWSVHFDPARGGPGDVTFDGLQDWTTRPEHGIRYFSGTATYKKKIHLEKKTGPLYLDLGAVNYLAEVRLNGNRVGVLWTDPWRLDISAAGRPGANQLEIAVSNVWANRLIGDEQEPADIIWEPGDPNVNSGWFLREMPEWFLKHEPRPSKGRYTFTTWNYFTKDSPLVPSGLMGPVTLRVTED